MKFKKMTYLLFSATVLLITVGINTVNADTNFTNQSGLVAKTHLTVKSGWSNDLQTIVWNDQTKAFDVYFQYSAS